MKSAYSNRFYFWMEPIPIGRATIRVWQILVPLVWVGIMFIWYLASGNSVAWWSWILGPLIVVSMSVVKTSHAKRLWLYLGVPYVFRPRSQNMFKRPLMGSAGRWAFRVVNSIALAGWYYFPSHILQSVSGEVPGMLIYFLLNIPIFLIVIWAIDQMWLFRRSRLAIPLSVFLWTGLIVIWVGWDWYWTGRAFCPEWFPIQACPL